MYQNLNEILSGKSGAWHMKKVVFLCMQSKSGEHEVILIFKTIFKTDLVFLIAITVYE